MNSPLLEIRDVAVLNALHRALVEAKFHADPNDALVASSELVASVADLVADALEDHERTHPRRVPREPGVWRDPAQHPEKLDVVRLRLAECEPWTDWSDDQRQEHVRVLLAPLRPEPETVSRLLQFANDEHGAS